MLLATVNKPVLLSVATDDGRTDLYARAQIINSSGGVISTVSLPHQTFGVYGANYTPATEGYYNVYYQLCFDPSYSISAGYGAAVEALDVNSFRTDILRLLGLVHQNSVVDSQIYDGNENLTSARIRCYDTNINANAASAISPLAYTTGQLFEYQMTATYSGSLLNKYLVTKVL